MNNYSVFGSVEGGCGALQLIAVVRVMIIKCPMENIGQNCKWGKNNDIRCNICKGVEQFQKVLQLLISKSLRGVQALVTVTEWTTCHASTP